MCFGKRFKTTVETNVSKSRIDSINEANSTMQDKYSPPAGPPPSYGYLGLEALGDYKPPDGPPPGHHDWQNAVPDNSLLPPPPMMGYDRSSANNATEDQASRATAWCENNPIAKPINLAPRGREALKAGIYGLSLPPQFPGEAREDHSGHFVVRSRRDTPDTCMTSGLPMYCVNLHSPYRTGAPKTIYFEVKTAPGRGEVGIGMGFLAAPYPPFRLPGWERASLGVHGDDGHRYVNDKWGGKDFTTPFRGGETIGIGMTFTTRRGDDAPAYRTGPNVTSPTNLMPLNVEVFFTRNGQRSGGWNLHEENDASQDLPVTGLEGLNDLYASVGLFDENDFEVVFAEEDWLFKM